MRIVAESGKEAACGLRQAPRGSADDTQVVTYGALRDLLGIKVGDSVVISAYSLPIATDIRFLLTEPAELSGVTGDLLLDYITPALLDDPNIIFRGGDCYNLRHRARKDECVQVMIVGVEPAGLGVRACPSGTTRVVIVDGSGVAYKPARAAATAVPGENDEADSSDDDGAWLPSVIMPLLVRRTHTCCARPHCHSHCS